MTINIFLDSPISKTGDINTVKDLRLQYNYERDRAKLYNRLNFFYLIFVIV